MARSRSGTRNTRGPRKPARRPEATFEGSVQTIDPSVRGAVEIPASITVKELAEQTKVSRITASIALARLEGMGLIEVRVIGNCRLHYWKGGGLQ